MNFYDLLPYTGMPRRIVEDLQTHAPWLSDPTPFLKQCSYFHGRNGVGKSLMAAHILATSLKNDTHAPYYLALMDPRSPEYNRHYPGPVFDHLFCWYPRLLQRIKSTFDRNALEGPSEDQLIQPIMRAAFLVLDDIGPEMATDWAYNILYLIVGERYDAQLPTIFTSNLSPAQLQAKFQDSRIVSRIFGMCHDRIYEIQGTDRRLNNT